MTEKELRANLSLTHVTRNLNITCKKLNPLEQFLNDFEK